ncbi:MAG: hypothetical protein ACE37H_07910 [Phycisphaeraceae bacterium]
MPSEHQDAWRVITLVRNGLQRLAENRLRNQADKYASINPMLQRLSTLSRGYDHACRRRFTGACRRLEPRIADQIRQLTHELQGLMAGRHAPQASLIHQPPTALPSPSFLLAELDQIESEFGSWEVLKGGSSLYVSTDPITLEGIHLDAFEIELRLDAFDRLDMEQPLSIHALDPNWASGADDVPHPHVRDERLCTGDATTILTQALREGRLADYLLIVRQTLTTYNPDSPHVALDDWDGIPCHDCGCSMTDDNRSVCERCDYSFCEDCFGCCQSCALYLCYGCLTSCRFCKDETCRECMKPCPECGQACCPGCFEEELCPECFEAHQQKESDHDDQPKQEIEETQDDENTCSQPSPPELSETPATPEVPDTQEASDIGFARYNQTSTIQPLAVDGGGT